MALSTSEAMLALVEESNFLRRITAGIVWNGLRVSREDPTTVNHARRLGLATNVLNDPRGNAEKFAWAVAADASINATYISTESLRSIPDADISNAIWSAWNAVSGS